MIYPYEVHIAQPAVTTLWYYNTQPILAWSRQKWEKT